MLTIIQIGQSEDNIVFLFRLQRVVQFFIFGSGPVLQAMVSVFSSLMESSNRKFCSDCEIKLEFLFSVFSSPVESLNL